MFEQSPVWGFGNRDADIDVGTLMDIPTSSGQKALGSRDASPQMSPVATTPVATNARSRTFGDSSTGRITPKLGYQPSLDGIRAVAVVAVLIFHGSSLWLPGGFLGVDVFFVLSGFLITSILLREVETTGRLNFKQFYLRRARRLLPALFAVLIVTAIIALVFAHDAAARVQSDIFASLAYVTNWANIWSGQSYFDAIGRPPLLQHLWSLAVEEQFYLVWPTVLLLAYRWRKRFGVRRVAMIGALVSTLLMAVLSVVGSMPGDNDASRLYFGSDTHAMTILVGALLATAWRPAALPKRLAPGPTTVMTLLGLGSLAAVTWTFLNVDDSSTFLYRGGFLVFAGLVAVVIAVSTHPAIRAGKLLGIQPLRYLGQRSYGLYLWHWPIFMVTRPGVDIDLTGLPAFALQMTLTLIVAELSYRFLEMPIRNGALGRAWNRWREQGSGVAIRKAGFAAAGAVAGCGALVLALSAFPPVDSSTYLDGLTSVGAESFDTPPSPEPSKSGHRDASPTASPSESPVSPALPGEDLTKRKITSVGDSVMLGAHVALQRELPNATIDAAVSRPATEMFARIRTRLNAGQLAPVVVIHGGTNGPTPEKDLRSILKTLNDRARVVLVTADMPRSWMNQNNDTIRTVAKDFPNVRLADWGQIAVGHREYFVPDGVHLTESGGKAYAAAIAAALKVA
ncbi:MAG: acyltransferase family protein [Actinomycetes bacterium]